jgi:hypothetical protein
VYGWPGDVVNHYYVGDRDKANVWEDLRQVKAEFDGEYTSIKVGPYEVRVLGQVEGEVHRKDSKSDIWRFDRPSKSEDHPTMKPLALCEEAIMNSSLRDQLVLDLFGGSGSTLIAADRVGRTCYMMELDPKYADVIRKRYAKHIGKENEWEAATPAIAGGQQSPDPTTTAPADQPPAEAPAPVPANDPRQHRLAPQPNPKPRKPEAIRTKGSGRHVRRDRNRRHNYRGPQHSVRRHDTGHILWLPYIPRTV